jgi:hypothetical protein
MYVALIVHIIMDHANDANILGRSIHTTKKNKEALVIASNEIGQEVNAVKTKYMVMSRDQNVGRSHDVEIDNSCCERVEQFRYLGTTLTNQNSIQEENKCRLKSQNAFYNSVQNTNDKTAHLKLSTNYWMDPVSLCASIFPYSKHKSTYTCYLCEVHSVLKEKKLPIQAAISLQCSHFHSNCFITSTV